MQDLAKQIPEQAKVCFSEAQDCNSAICLAYLSQQLKIYSLGVTAAKAALNLHMFFLVRGCQFERSISPNWFMNLYIQKLSLIHSK